MYQYRLAALGLASLALVACTKPGPATLPSTPAAPAIGADLGSSSWIPRIAGLAGEGEGYGRTEPGPAPLAQNSPGGMPMNHGAMSG